MTDADGLSVLDGGPIGPGVVPHLAAALVRAARLPGAGDLTLIDAAGVRRRLSYADLLEQAGAVLAGIRRAEVARCGAAPEPGAIVVIQVEDAGELLAAFWACQLGGYLPVPLAAGATPAERTAARATLAATCDLLGSPFLLRDDPPPVGTVAIWLGGVAPLLSIGPRKAPEPFAPDPADPAVLLLTSGSTGRPKAVTLTHAGILARSTASIAARGLTRHQRSFNWLPLDHVGGLVMFHLRDVVLACTQVHAAMAWVLADPLRWPATMSRERSTCTWAPNFAFSLIVDRAVDLVGMDWDLSPLGYVMNGGEPVKPATARRFLDLLAPYGLPASAMHPGWGMSETSSGVVDRVFDPSADHDERFVPLGRPHPGVRLRVVDDAGALVPTGRIGRLQATGAAVTPGYFRNPEQNRQCFTADGWFKTGDLALIRDGTLIVAGRADDVIEVAGVAYHGHEMEAAIEELGCVLPSFVVACAVPVNETANEIALFVTLRPGVDPEPAVVAIRDRLRERFGLTDVLVRPVAADRIPKSGIGKLRRSVLRDDVATTRST
jgi:acyl-CoA synthetase (AMP-forming)/AMP-acid ligase II